MLEYLLLLIDLCRGLLRSRSDLVAENLLLRQQLAVLTRPTRQRPRPRTRDKLFWIVARRICRDWRRHLAVVRPETVIGWHRRGWRLLWRWTSRARGGRPRLSGEVRDPIARMARENPAWGAERIRGERLKLGIVVSKRPVQQYRRRGPARPPSQSWRTSLANHRPSICAADLFTVQTQTFETLYVLLFISHGGASWSTGTSPPTRPPHGSGDSSSKPPRGAGRPATRCGTGTRCTAATSRRGSDAWASRRCSARSARPGRMPSRNG